MIRASDGSHRYLVQPGETKSDDKKLNWIYVITMTAAAAETVLTLYCIGDPSIIVVQVHGGRFYL